MAMVLTERYSHPRKFYTARFARFYQAYFVILAVMLGWCWFTNSPTAFTSRLPVP